MAWTLNSVTIHPDAEGDVHVEESLHSIQEILDSQTEYISYYGAHSPRRSLTFVLIEDENSNTGLDSLKTATRAGTTVNLTSDQGSQGNFRILTLRASRRHATNKTYPAYNCTAELIAV